VGGHAEEAEGSFLLEVERAGGRRLDAADPPAEIGDLGPHRRLGEHAQAERQSGRGDVVAAFDREREPDRVEVVLVEPAMLGRCDVSHGDRRWLAGARLRLRGIGLAQAWRTGRRAWQAPGGAMFTDRRKQAEGVPVPEHPRGGAEAPGGFRNAHGK
jgi:hypothetical protein